MNWWVSPSLDTVEFCDIQTTFCIFKYKRPFGTLQVQIQEALGFVEQLSCRGSTSDLKQTQ